MMIMMKLIRIYKEEQMKMKNLDVQNSDESSDEDQLKEDSNEDKNVWERSWSLRNAIRSMEGQAEVEQGNLKNVTECRRIKRSTRAFQFHCLPLLCDRWPHRWLTQEEDGLQTRDPSDCMQRVAMQFLDFRLFSLTAYNCIVDCHTPRTVCAHKDHQTVHRELLHNSWNSRFSVSPLTTAMQQMAS